MTKKMQWFVILPLMGLFMTGSAQPQNPVIKCKDCTRFPGTKCWPEVDWQELEDAGCITAISEPCAPFIGRRYTITWTGSPVTERPNERVLWCRGAVAPYHICYRGNVLNQQYRACPPVFFPPVSGKGFFMAEAARGTATPVLYSLCGSSGIVIPYYAAVACGMDGDHTVSIEVTRQCR